MYDYGAMMYDPATGRRNNIDQKAESSRRWSPYSYCYDNPMYFVDPDGMQGQDWYRNLKTNAIAWKEGNGEVKGYEHLAYNVSDQSYGKDKTDHLVMDGDTKQITINGNVVADYNKSSNGDKPGGFMFSDGQDNSSHDGSAGRRGSDVDWRDGGGFFELFILLLSTDRESPTANKATPDTQAKNTIDAVSNTADATKEALKEKPKKPDMVYIHKDDKNPNKNVQVSREVYEAQQKKKNENKK